MQLNTPITIHRRLWGRTKVLLGIIKPRGWHDRPFYADACSKTNMRELKRQVNILQGIIDAGGQRSEP